MTNKQKKILDDILPLIKIPAGCTIEKMETAVKVTFRDKKGNLCKPKIFSNGEEVELEYVLTSNSEAEDE